MRRRNFLQISLGSVMAAGLAKAAEVCRLTPRQTEGPFYPVKDQKDKDWDLTQIAGHSEKARGQVLWVGGQVRDQSCNPVEGVLVEIWQACVTGKYNHPADPNMAPLDPHFQYWGKFLTGHDGRYVFKTIKPGAYPASPDWIRPSHIHFKVTKLGYLELITQLYFAGDEHQSRDRILQRIPHADQEQVVRPIETREHEGESVKWVEFPLQIEKA